jgi:DNA-binding NarL/FixJ family response regulator
MTIIGKRVEILLVEDDEGDVGLIEEALEEAKKDGREVLREIKEDKDLKSIPVVVLTTSGAEKDILRAYELHANAYVTKPLDFDQFIKRVESIVNFWIEIVKLPAK